METYKTCTNKDCPDLLEEILSRLCDIWYPYGSKRRYLKTYQNGMREKEWKRWNN